MDTTSEWGRYAPTSASWPLRALIRIGLARGKIKKRILRKWKQRFGSIIDFKVSGIKYRLNLDDNVTDRRIFTSHDRYDSSEVNLLKKISHKGLFMDIGANVGFYTLALAASGAKVIAVEPNPKTLARLNYNTTLNNFADRITILPIGIGEKGEFELVSNGGLGSANIRPDNTNYSEAVTITVQPLLDVLTELKIEKLDGLKIDIEGMEDRALMPFFKSAPKSLWPKCIVIEHCNSDHWQNDVISSMKMNGYKIKLRTRSNSVLIKSLHRDSTTFLTQSA
jgi:FkbM family methyltransferase